MPTPRLIKKYPNRRLYDTELSRYITFSDIRGLVMQGVEFRMQIMLEEESGGEPLFTATMLAQIIRFYGGSVQGLFTRYLEESLSLFEEQQNEIRETMGANPMETMTEMAQRNIDLWSDMQNSFLQSMGVDLDAGKKTKG